MREMICPKCGHDLENHGLAAGCLVKVDDDYCDCVCSYDILMALEEARHWARRMMQERDEAWRMYDLVVTDLHHWKGEFAASNGYFWRMMRERDAIQAKAQEQAEMIQRDCTSPYEVSEMLSTIARMADEFEKVKTERDELRLASTNTKFRSRETWIWKD